MIEDAFNWNSKYVIYIISCLKCNRLYVGQTARIIKDSSDIKLNKLTASSLNLNEPRNFIRDLKTTVANIYDFG